MREWREDCEREEDAAVSWRNEDIQNTKRGQRIHADAQSLSYSDSPEQDHPALFKAGSPSRRLTTDTNRLDAESTGEFTLKETQTTASGIRWFYSLRLLLYHPHAHTVKILYTLTRLQEQILRQ